MEHAIPLKTKPLCTVKPHIERLTWRLAENPAGFELRSALDYLILREAQAAEKAGIDPSFYSPVIKDMLFGFMIGGQDSTHSTLCFTAKRLGEFPEMQETLRDCLYKAHADAYQTGRQPATNEISKTQVPYLDAFIQEVLRLNPLAPVVVRQTYCDTFNLGHFFPKGTMLVLVIDGPTFINKRWDFPEEIQSETSRMHEGLGDWADSAYHGDKFQPERWLRSG